MWLRAATLAAVMLMLGCGGGPEAEPVKLEDACQRHAEAGCKKNAECAPPEEADCVSKQVAECIAKGNENGPSCVQTAANAIDACAPKLDAMTCDDYCGPPSSDGFNFCFAPCFWFC
jgi:hypothetical protein